MEAKNTAVGGSRSKFMQVAGMGILAFSFAAFALKGIAHPERLARYTPLVIAHGVLMLAWLALFVWQARLIFTGNRRLHVAGGSRSWILILLIVVVSSHISYSLMLEFQSATVFIANMFMLAAFLGFFLAAILAVRRKDTDSHKRYMFFASLTITLPAFGRAVDVLLDQEMLSLPLFVIFVIALPIAYDRLTGQRIHRATVIGIIASIGWLALMAGSMFSPLGDVILGLVG